MAAALVRKESRGSHYRDDFTERDDENWLKTTIAKYNEQTDKADLDYEPVETPLVEPRLRNYGAVK